MERKCQKLRVDIEERYIYIKLDDTPVLELAVDNKKQLVIRALDFEHVRFIDRLLLEGCNLDVSCGVFQHRSKDGEPVYRVGTPGVISTKLLKDEKPKTNIKPTTADTIEERIRDQILQIIVPDPKADSKVIADKLGIGLYQVAGVKANLTRGQYSQAFLDRFRK